MTDPCPAKFTILGTEYRCDSVAGHVPASGPGHTYSGNTEPIEGAYGTATHAAIDALNVDGYLVNAGFVSASVSDVAAAVVAGLRDRGFSITRKERCGSCPRCCQIPPGVCYEGA